MITYEKWLAVFHRDKGYHPLGDVIFDAGVAEGLGRAAPASVSDAEPVGEIVLFGIDPQLKEVSWRKGKMPPDGTKLYAAPTQSTQQPDNRAEAAIRTLEGMGYTHTGGEQWRPPLGKKPAFLNDAQRPQMTRSTNRSSTEEATRPIVVLSRLDWRMHAMNLRSNLPKLISLAAKNARMRAVALGATILHLRSSRMRGSAD